MRHPNGNEHLFQTDKSGEFIYIEKGWRDYLHKKAAKRGRK